MASAKGAARRASTAGDGLEAKPSAAPSASFEPAQGDRQSSAGNDRLQTDGRRVMARLIPQIRDNAAPGQSDLLLRRPRRRHQLG